MRPHSSRRSRGPTVAAPEFIPGRSASALGASQLAHHEAPESALKSNLGFKTLLWIPGARPIGVLLLYCAVSKSR
jgi:hypothetical protein